MDPSKPIPEIVLFFKSTFVIVLALALAEAFRQSVSDKVQEPEHQVIFWPKLPALCSFLLLIIPFYQGMSRYFFVTYADLSKLPEPYSIYLMIDTTFFLAESALFFVMSRTLAMEKWAYFYGTVLALLYVDSIWGLVTSLHGAPIGTWSVLNLVFGGAITALLLRFWATKNFFVPAFLGLAAMFVRTLLDYYLTWSFYFPPK